MGSGDTLALQRADVAGDMLACGKQCWGAGNCATACMAQREGLSQRCARCFSTNFVAGVTARPAPPRTGPRWGTLYQCQTRIAVEGAVACVNVGCL